jgi:hypothetical protein
MNIKAMENYELINMLKKYEDMLIENPMLEYNNYWLETVEMLIIEMQARKVYSDFEENLILDDIEGDFKNYH